MVAFTWISVVTRYSLFDDGLYMDNGGSSSGLNDEAGGQGDPGLLVHRIAARWLLRGHKVALPQDLSPAPGPEDLDSKLRVFMMLQMHYIVLYLLLII